MAFFTKKQDPQQDIQLCLQRRDYKGAVVAFKQLLDANPRSTQMRLRYADTLVLAGRKRDAVAEYIRVTGEMAESGFLIQAIAIAKKAVQLDPSQGAVHERLAQLNAQRAALEVRAPAPAAPASGFSAAAMDFEEGEAMELDIGRGLAPSPPPPEPEPVRAPEPEPEVDLDAIGDLGSDELTPELVASAHAAPAEAHGALDLAPDLEHEAAPEVPAAVEEEAAVPSTGFDFADGGADHALAPDDLVPAEEPAAAEAPGSFFAGGGEASGSGEGLGFNFGPPDRVAAESVPAPAAGFDFGGGGATAAEPPAAAAGFDFGGGGTTAAEPPAAAAGLAFGGEAEAPEREDGFADLDQEPAVAATAPPREESFADLDQEPAALAAPFGETAAPGLEPDPGESADNLLGLLGEDVDAMIDAIMNDVGDSSALDLAEPEAATRIPLFSDLTVAEFVDVTSLLARRVVRKGTAIVRQGEPGTSMFIISDGAVEAAVERQGRRQTLARLGAGDFFGEMAVLTGAPRTATVTAVDNTELLELDRDHLQEISARHPGVAAKIRHAYEERAAHHRQG